MSWTAGILDVWRWGKTGLIETYDYHLRPACPKCTDHTISTPPAPVVSDIVKTVEPTMAVSGLTRLAGLSGAAAISLGAYGAHVLAPKGKEVNEEQVKAFEVANRYHMVHSVALLGVPLVRAPRVTGFLMVGGMVVFCGTTYYHALTGDKQYRRLTPYGGMLLIAAWLSMIL